MQMGSLVLTTLSVFLGLFFIFVGSMKLTPAVNRDMHREIRRNFVQYAKVFPLAKVLGYKVPSKVYRVSVGWLEVVCGITLLLIPGFLKQIANILLLLVMLGGFYTHTLLADKFEKLAPSIVFSLMLGCRLVVYVQLRRKDRKLAEKMAASLKVPIGSSLNDDLAVPGSSKVVKQD